jgi:hypothetical protein
MGLSVKDDPRKVVDIASRAWGEPVNGLALSVLLKLKEDPDELPTVAVAIHNRGGQARHLQMRGWLNFYEVSVLNSGGAQAMLTPYGAELGKPERLPAPSEVVLPAGEATEADIPIASIFAMPRGRYRVRVSCAAPEHLTSNEVQVDV